MNPPKDISGFELFDKLSETPRLSVSVPFPRNDKATGAPLFDVLFVVLNDSENMAAIASSEKAAKELLKGVDISKDSGQSLGYEALFNNMMVSETLVRAVRNPNDVTKPFFPSRKAIQSALTSDEIAILFRNYIQVRTKFGAIISELSADELETWVQKLAEGAETGSFLLDQLHPELWKDLIVYMAFRLANSKTDIT